jgi:hypothetical protein
MPKPTFSDIIKTVGDKLAADGVITEEERAQGLQDLVDVLESPDDEDQLMMKVIEAIIDHAYNAGAADENARLFDAKYQRILQKANKADPQ